jgi:hypothetical protein
VRLRHRATIQRDVAAVAAGQLRLHPRGLFTSVPVNDQLSSSVVGPDIYNSANEDLGTIKDIAFADGRAKAYIVGVGGFLGMGDHDVSVRPAAVTLSYDDGTQNWRAEIDTDADQLRGRRNTSLNIPASQPNIDKLSPRDVINRT